jgi:RNA polymerase sigma-70 factor (ECF subfamily)
MGAFQRAISDTMALDLSTTERQVSQSAVAWDIESLVREHSRLVFRIAYSVVRNRDDAEDVVQEVFLRLAKHGTNGIDDPKAWISRVAWRVAVDRYRQFVREPQEEFDEKFHVPAVVRADGEQTVISQQMLALLDRLIATLPRKEREALLLTSVKEMTSAEAAKVLGASETAVRARVFRARQRLNEKLQNVLGEGYGR